MKNKTILGIFALMIVGIVGVGLVSAHGGETEEDYDMTDHGMMGMFDRYNWDMHDDVDQIITEGTYQDLETLREEYRMPIMHWVDTEEEFEQAKEYHENNDRNYGWMPCHG